MNRVGGVMVIVLDSTAVDRGFEPRSGQTKGYEMMFVSPLLNMEHQGERTKTGWLGIRIMCPSGATYLSADCCFSELALKKSN